VTTTPSGRALARQRQADRIVYELDGELQVLDVKTGKSTHLSIHVPDDGINRRPATFGAN